MFRTDTLRFVECLVGVDRQADAAGVEVKRTGHRLADPPADPVRFSSIEQQQSCGFIGLADVDAGLQLAQAAAEAAQGHPRGELRAKTLQGEPQCLIGGLPADRLIAAARTDVVDRAPVAASQPRRGSDTTSTRRWALDGVTAQGAGVIQAL